MNNRKTIAKNVAMMLKDGDIVNLGIGIPTLVSSFIPDDITVLFHAENGCLGAGKAYERPWNSESTRESVIRWLDEHDDEYGDWRTQHRDLCNAGNESISLVPGACCFDTVTSFAIARGGRLSATVLGAFQVDRDCNLANWKIPGKKMNGMGGAMDLVSGSKRVIIAMEHCAKNGEPKIVEKCNFPLTALGCVTDIVTELCIIKCTPGNLLVTALAPNVSKEYVQERTATQLQFSKNLQLMLLD